MSEKRNIILEQVLGLLHMHTHEKFTMKNVADHLGLSKSSLYEYFPNKATMITDAILQMMAENQATVRNIENESALDYEAHLNAHLQNLMALTDKNRMMQQLMYHPEVNILPPEMKLRVFKQMQSTKKSLTEKFHEILQKGVAEGKVEPPIDPWKERMIESMILGVMMERSNPENVWEPQVLLKTLNSTIHELMTKKR